jgi:hypothetical protein
MTPQEIIEQIKDKHQRLNLTKGFINDSIVKEVWNKALAFASENVEVNEEELSYGLDGQVYYDTVQIDKHSILKHKI